jgi:flagellar biosynthetic protein FliO
MLSLLTNSFIFKAFIRRGFFFLLAMLPVIGVSDEPLKTSPPLEVNSKQPDISPFLVEEEKPEPLPEDHFFHEFLNMLGTLALLIAFMVFASWVLKRMLNQRVQQLNTSSNIKVVEKRALSNKAAIYLIEIDGKTFLVGESMNNLSLIANFPNGLSTPSEHEMNT